MYRSDHDAALTRARIAFRELRDAAEEKGAPMLEAPPAATDSASELTRLAERCEALRTVLESKPSLAIPTMGMVGPSLELRKRSRRVVMLIGFPPLALVVVLRGTWGAAAVVAALLKAAALLVALHVVVTNRVGLTVDGEGLLLQRRRARRRIGWTELTDCAVEWRSRGQKPAARLTLELASGETLRLEDAETAPTSAATLVAWARLVRGRIGEADSPLAGTLTGR